MNDSISKFLELAKSGLIEDLLNRRSTLNLPFPTAGGKVCWDTVECNGWKLQTNVFFGNWRILDRNNIRRAWGANDEQLQALLSDRTTSVLANYCEDGYSFADYPAAGKSAGTVVLLHGWGVRGHSMDKLAKMLSSEGFDVLSYDYPTSAHSIKEHARIFLKLFRKKAVQGKLFVLTHSMGGLILRMAMSEMTETECRQISAIVMLGPPNCGSLLALIGKNELIRTFNASLGDMAPNAESLNIRAPRYLPPTGIIAGAFDGKVAFADTALPDGIPCQRITVDCTHPGLRNPLHTGSAILNFFHRKTF